MHARIYMHTYIHCIENIYLKNIHMGLNRVSPKWAVFIILMTIRVACEHMDFLSLRSRGSIDQIWEGFV